MSDSEEMKLVQFANRYAEQGKLADDLGEITRIIADSPSGALERRLKLVRGADKPKK